MPQQMHTKKVCPIYFKIDFLYVDHIYHIFDSTCINHIVETNQGGWMFLWAPRSCHNYHFFVFIYYVDDVFEIFDVFFGFHSLEFISLNIITFSLIYATFFI